MTEIWAHRGCSMAAPENSLPAFRLALDSGAEGVEFDVQLTRDRVPVVIHDETVDRTHLGTGWVKDLTAAEVTGLSSRLGSGATIPTLDEVLAVFADSTMTINIELKNSIVRDPELEPAVLDAVARFDLADRVVLSSFDHYSVRRLVSAGSGCEVAAIYSDPLLRPWDYLAGLGVAAVHPPLNALDDPGFVAEAQARGLSVRPWFSNDADELGRVFASGVDAVFTDDPALALRVRGALAS